MDNNAVVDYRARLLEKLLESTDMFCAACRAVKNPHKPFDEHGWSIHRLAHHVRDVDVQSYGMRARRTLTEQYPSFPKFDADTWASEHYDAHEALENILSEL